MNQRCFRLGVRAIAWAAASIGAGQPRDLSLVDRVTPREAIDRPAAAAQQARTGAGALAKSGAPGRASSAEDGWSIEPGVLTFERRLAAQHTIEEVYWRHRIWPDQNPRPKPMLEELMPGSMMREKVEDYLRESSALGKLWGRPLTPEQLQAEIERMARDTRNPEVLQELFMALDNDPVLIAECLARQTLAGRLIRSWYAQDERFHGTVKRQAEEARARDGTVEGMKGLEGNDRITTAGVSWPKTPFDTWWRAEGGSFSTDVMVFPGHYTLPHSPSRSASIGCSYDSWAPTNFQMERRAEHVAVWTGSEMIVWGGYGGEYGYNLSSGGRYDPSTDTWAPAQAGTDVPSPRKGASAVWTGSEMIVWGGSDGSSPLGTGARYSPATNRWAATSEGAGVPSARIDHTAVWAGSEMIVWGGFDGSARVRTGSRYNPLTDTWAVTSTGAGVPAARSAHTAVWTGSVMIVWGGTNGTSPASTGSRYNPSTNTWAATTLPGAPAARFGHTAVWTGTRMIVWAGTSGSAALNTGGRYDPSANAWVATSTGTGTPSARSSHTAIWTGSEMIVWGGFGPAIGGGSTVLNDGGRYTPSADTWAGTGMGGGLPTARSEHTAVWTGSEMIVWGGSDLNTGLSSGGRYNPSADDWVATNLGGPNPTFDNVVWTGSEMLVWGSHPPDFGGGGPPAEGGRYDPATDMWSPIPLSESSAAALPGARSVWTGTEMIIWGGTQIITLDPGSTNTLGYGGRYNPTTNTWTSVSSGAGVPTGRSGHQAVWTGTRMVVWGGASAGSYNATGGRYDPSTDTWTPTAIDANTPTGVSGPSMVWTGGEVIVWGGYDGNVRVNTGGRYNPVADTWARTSVGANVPLGRSGHRVVWTGSDMIVWGGYDGTTYLADGARYVPLTDSWIPTNMGANAPSARAGHSAVWTGREMIVWGGAGADAYLDTGGRYSASGDFWLPTSTQEDAPSPRSGHSAFATGSEMVVWGGGRNTGGLYCYACTATTWYRDNDGDGYGDPDLGVSSCGQPPGYSAAAGDCNDASAAIHPGASEICDGLDNDCDGTIDNATAPSGVPALVVGKPASSTARLVWDALPAASGYDIVRGSLAVLRSSGGDFTLATELCLENNLVTTTRDDTTLPDAGQGFWFLVRAENCGGPASYDSGAPSQVGSRDAGIRASSVGCP